MSTEYRLRVCQSLLAPGANAMISVLAAVFIPMALVGGRVGAIYKQFSLTIAISMAISP